MHFEILTEEMSAVAALQIIVPRIVPGTSLSFHAYQGKYDLFKKIPIQLKGYAANPHKNWRYIVLTDRDQEDCEMIKNRIDSIASDCKLIPSTETTSLHYNFLGRIAIEELEAWFFGDLEAIHKAYPKVDYNHLSRCSDYADPDNIQGGTWEALFQELKQAKYVRRGLPKIRTAKAIAKYMNPDINRSASFRAFRDGLRRLRKTVL
jgi:hypothetical protein